MRPLVLSADDGELLDWMKRERRTEDDYDLVAMPADLDDLVIGERRIVVLPAFNDHPDFDLYAAKMSEALRRSS